MNFQTFSDEEAWISAALHVLKQTSSGKPHTSIALSGGSTPQAIYRSWFTYISKNNITDVDFFLVDERYVPIDHPDSNAGMIKQLLPDTRKKNLHTFDTSKPIPEALKAYEDHLPEHFDLVVLGIGSDGHTASLFPHTPTLSEKQRLVAHTTTDEFAVHDRLTLTFPAIMQAKHLLLLAKGTKKQNILHDLVQSKKSIDELPAKKLLEHKKLTILFLDG